VGRFTCCKEHEVAIFLVRELHMDRIIKAEDDPKFREAKRFGLQKERERRKTYIRFGLQGNLREHLVCFRLGLHSSA
jgi:hypothetical protein